MADGACNCFIWASGDCCVVAAVLQAAMTSLLSTEKVICLAEDGFCCCCSLVDVCVDLLTDKLLDLGRSWMFRL